MIQDYPYLAIHYADEQPQRITEETLLNWARDEIATYDLVIEDLTPEKAIAILHDKGDITIVKR